MEGRDAVLRKGSEVVMARNDVGRLNAPDPEPAKDIWRELKSAEKPQQNRSDFSIPKPPAAAPSRCPHCKAQLSAVERKMMHCLSCGKQVASTIVGQAPETGPPASDFTVKI